MDCCQLVRWAGVGTPWRTVAARLTPLAEGRSELPGRRRGVIRRLGATSELCSRTLRKSSGLHGGERRGQARRCMIEQTLRRLSEVAANWLRGRGRGVACLGVE